LIPVRDKWFRITVIILPFLFDIGTNDLLVTITVTALKQAFISLMAIVLVCEGSRFIIYKSWIRFPKNRILFTYAIGVLFTTIVLVSSKAISKGTAHAGSSPLTVSTDFYINGHKWSLGIVGFTFLKAILNFSILFAGYDLLYRNARMRQTEKENEKLEKEKLRAELNQLKGIVNPHFLFNNLNSLSALIGEDPPQAEKFLDELTAVFRYLLRNHQTELATLQEELQFIQSYYRLLQMRYGSAIQLKVDIDREYEAMLLPPLTLQLLIENAVKHNQLRKEKPLKIELFARKSNNLVVQNTICKKETGVESTGIGLQTINARYRMINMPDVAIESTSGYFAVSIPLVPNLHRS
jgi:two-component system, LytTR family, sensor kinase